METAKQPVWPPHTFEKILTPIVVLTGLLVLALSFSVIRLFILICVLALTVGIAWFVVAVLWLAAKTLWQTFFGR